MASAAASILTPFLVVLVLMGSANSHPVCGKNCKPARNFHPPCIQHVSELQRTSISPWTLQKWSESEYFNIEEAKCSTCNSDSLVAKPIYIRINVPEKVRNGTEVHWCDCLKEVAVGCTCVPKPQTGRR